MSEPKQFWLRLEQPEAPDTPIMMMMLSEVQRDFVAGLLSQCGYVAQHHRHSADGSLLAMAQEMERGPAAPAGHQPAPCDLTVLTARETQVLDLVAAGYTSKEVALKLDISPRTVENYRAQIMRKLDVDCLAKLIRITLNAAQREGAGLAQVS